MGLHHLRKLEFFFEEATIALKPDGWLILDEFEAALGIKAPPVTARWTGIYASAPDRLMFRDTPMPGVRIVMITSGTGASTSFAIAEETITELQGEIA